MRLTMSKLPVSKVPDELTLTCLGQLQNGYCDDSGASTCEYWKEAIANAFEDGVVQQECDENSDGVLTKSECVRCFSGEGRTVRVAAPVMS